MAFVSIRKLQAYAEQVQHTLTVRELATAVLDDAQNAETGQRGYLLTKKDEYLGPFHAAETQVKKNIAELLALTQSDTEQYERARAVEANITVKFDELRRTIALTAADKPVEALALVNGDTGKRAMDAIRDGLRAFIDVEIKALTDKQAEATAERNFVIWLIIIALASALATAVTILTLTRSFVAGLAKETKNRQAAEDTLRQAQKMEAVGQLTGGIAHDFNNLLTIIMGNLDTLKRRTANAAKDQDAQHLAAVLTKPIDTALQGARSAAQLTQRLLAFSRQQPLSPARVDVNQLVAGMSELLRRTVGETIAVETVLAGGLWPSYIDAHQLESALVNLVVNARDAMPDGGRITIETANAYLDEAYAARFGDIAAGQYVALSVTDTGQGMPREILERAFEPFFTTKGTGKGTGLGLAMVHGFVKQSGGHARIYSEIGVGTTVKLYLRRQTQAEEAAAAPADRPLPVAEVARAKTGETILFVEDNAEVREYGVAVLEDMGYRVIEAGDGDGAINACEAAERIDLLFTDVVLPGGMNGRVLADKIVGMRPGIAVLYTTGYTRNAIIHNGQLDAGVHLLNKPYTQQELTRKVRELLDKA